MVLPIGIPNDILWEACCNSSSPIHGVLKYFILLVLLFYYLSGDRWEYSIVLLICICQITSEVEHIQIFIGYLNILSCAGTSQSFTQIFFSLVAVMRSLKCSPFDRYIYYTYFLLLCVTCSDLFYVVLN